MISYTIISQEVYANLLKLSQAFPTQKSFLTKANLQLIHKIELSQQETKQLHLDLQALQNQNTKLSSHIDVIEAELNRLSLEVIQQSNREKTLSSEKDETVKKLMAALEQKTKVEEENMQLMDKLQSLQIELTKPYQKIHQLQENQQLLQSEITQLKSIINRLNIDNGNILQNLQEKSVIIQNLNIEVSQKSELIQKIVNQYELCKEQKLAFQKQIQIFKESPIPKLKQKIQANQTWINQLTKTINELKHRCVELEMNRPQPTVSHTLISNAPYPMIPAILNSIKPRMSYFKNKTTPGFKTNHQPPHIQQIQNINKPCFQETERLKYLTICKQLVQKFNQRLSKIQQQKKQMQQKYQSIKLKLNEYQYKEFTYKDKLSLYMEKIQRFERLTLKQQQEMEKLILQFDQELNNVIKMKEDEVKYKLQEEIIKYQQLLKVKEQGEHQKRHEAKSQANDRSMRSGTDFDEFDYLMLKQQLDNSYKKLQEKTIQLQRVSKDLAKTNKQLQKTKQSKQSYKQKFKEVEQQSYNSFIQVRRYKTQVQQLCQQLEIKINENEILKSILINNKSDNINANNKKNNQDFYESLSAKISPRNNISLGKRSGSDHFEYQVSQIDTELQKRNDLLMNRILLDKKLNKNYINIQRVINTPAGPSKSSQVSDPAMNSEYWSRYLHPLNESINSVSKSQISSQSESEQSIQSSLNKNSNNNSQNNSMSSKNSYQSYGIKYLYKDRSNASEVTSQKFLIHKNSLQ